MSKQVKREEKAPKKCQNRGKPKMAAVLPLPNCSEDRICPVTSCDVIIIIIQKFVNKKPELKRLYCVIMLYSLHYYAHM